MRPEGGVKESDSTQRSQNKLNVQTANLVFGFLIEKKVKASKTNNKTFILKGLAKAIITLSEAALILFKHNYSFGVQP